MKVYGIDGRELHAVRVSLFAPIGDDSRWLALTSMLLLQPPGVYGESRDEAWEAMCDRFRRAGWEGVIVGSTWQRREASA